MWYPPVEGWVRCYVMVDKQNCKYLRNDYHGHLKHTSTASNPLLNHQHTEYYDLSALLFSGTLDLSTHPSPHQHQQQQQENLVTLRDQLFSRTFHLPTPAALSAFTQTLHTLSTVLLLHSGDGCGGLADVRKVQKPKGTVRLAGGAEKGGFTGEDRWWLQEVRVDGGSRVEGRWAGDGSGKRVVVAEVKLAAGGGKGWVKEVEQGIRSQGLRDSDARLIKTYLSQLALPYFDQDNTFQLNQILRSSYLGTL